MAFPTKAEIEAKSVSLLREHWPSIIILILTWYGWLVDDDYMGHVVQAVGAAGVIVCCHFLNCKKIYGFISQACLYAS